ncbi:MAG: SGNH/GDSL hydrolase family protein [Actinomycetota bacterium]
MKVAVVTVAIIFSLLALLEASLRLIGGFGNPLIYIPDRHCGYRLAPNQRVRRFGNRIEINQYSMRNSATASLPPPLTLRVLLLGDSVANGGWWTDQADTISAILTQRLSHQEGGQAGEKGERGKGDSQRIEPTSSPTTHFNVEVLNASANSWGPRNQLGYLKEFGDFGAVAVVVLLNTDDLFTKVPCSSVVGRDRNYPNRKPFCAIVEICYRYLLPEPATTESAGQNQETGDIVGYNLEAIRQIHQLATQANRFFLLAMTPLLRELGSNGPRNYELIARNRLTKLTQTEQILYLDFLPIFNAVQQPVTLYRDSIHLSQRGNQLVSKTISQAIANLRI